ncbi:MAG TPA: hypothetical protein PKK33_10440, partial [Candidatus Cloacimonadota bacterium]|nr:hypothetical protein [Candidatus Cloacimonadota bacterium]
MLKYIYRNLQNLKNTAFIINDTPYTYEETYRLVNNYLSFLQTLSDIDSIGIVMHNDIETYAMIIVGNSNVHAKGV